MDSETATSTMAWAFAAAPADGVPALEALAEELVWLGAMAPESLLSCSGHAHERARVSGARELMSALLSAAMPCNAAAQAALYVIVASRVYAALVIETVERRRRGVRPALPDAAASTAAAEEREGEGEDEEKTEQHRHLLAGVRATMQAWVCDLVPMLVDVVLPRLHLHDAEPTTVTVSQPLGRGLGAPRAVPDDAAGQTELLDVLATYPVREALVHLVDAVCHSTSDGADELAASLLLAAYATLCHTEVCPRATAGPENPTGATTATLRRWHARLLSDMIAATDEHAASSSAPQRAVSNTHGAVLHDCLQRLYAIAKEAQRGRGADVLVFAFAALQSPRLTSAGDATLHASDVERGTAPQDATAASLAMEHDRDVEAFTLVAVDDVDARQCDGGATAVACIASSPLCRQGALLLLADALRCESDPAAAHSLAYSASAASLLIGVADALVVSLRCACGAAALLRHLLLLRELVLAVPKYTIRCAGEARRSHALSTGEQRLDLCLTRRYQAFFDVEKELLTLSALCPVEEHRRISRVVALELLERLEERARVRMHGSLLALCPYHSIARFFLDQLLRDWRAAQSATEHAVPPETSPLHTAVPAALQECALAFLSQASSGASGFIDPLVVTLNFVRVEVSRRTWLRSPSRRAASASAGDEAAMAVLRAWGRLLHVLRAELLPRCHALLRRAAVPPPPESDAAAHFTVSVALSPLDLFSLSCAVDGLEEVLKTAAPT
ncbi:hypothetical protein NESM_000098500 [Novymonas esmeraldas]|uniref:Uncharacterized protein n=1 Tax=Novymonas esmeraldas TaxID=1808958 RepID=A0AAW0F4T5_9TRYP